MTSLAAFLAWLLQAPRWLRVAQTTRVLLAEAVRALLEPETGQLRALTPDEVRMVERSVQTAEAGVALAIWLLAHLEAGLPAPRWWAVPRFIPSRRPPTPLALAHRTFELCVRIETLHARARALSLHFVRRLSASAAPSASSHGNSGEPGSRDSRISYLRARRLTPVSTTQANFSCFRRVRRPKDANLLALYGITSIGQTGPPARRTSHSKTV